ncbi:MAG TPA: hypothetical protein VE988_10105 [Gemmataceae bacterium]|nr:hypothetical protein [Gemmataceae bacterium]
MNIIKPENVAQFLARFYDFHDALLVTAAYDWLVGGGTCISVKMETRDQQAGGHSFVRLRISEPEEVVFREVNTSLQMLKGLRVKWFDDLVWLSFQEYSSQIETVEDFRNSYFYVAGQVCFWEIIPKETILGGWIPEAKSR